ncbi:hypothetical protein LWI28_025528 [Acer negundo]|uniref:Serine/threonine specific protein phosphatases domain-containing protein n=1 Tax=Acer negundo TaxID=4023 RepID=A0AAD5IGA2_ACENE|nr:hypothetical protein LWI28_025528 [Acer negundo]
MLGSACNIISKHCVLDSSQQRLLEKLELEVGSRTDERLVGLKAETQTKEQDPSVQASSMPSMLWPQNGCITLEWIRVLISTFKWASWKDPKDFQNLMPVAVVMLPDRVYLLRGNHESKDWTLKYGFLAELIITSHESSDARAGQDDSRNMLNGYSKDHDVVSGKLFTLFIAPSYPQMTADIYPRTFYSELKMLSPVLLKIREGVTVARAGSRSICRKNMGFWLHQDLLQWWLVASGYSERLTN